MNNWFRVDKSRNRIKIYSIVFIVLAVPLDYISTLYGLSSTESIEANPIVRLSIDNGVFLEFLVIGGIFISICSYLTIHFLDKSDKIRLHIGTEFVYIMLCILMSIIVLNNILIGLNYNNHIEILTRIL